MLPIRHAVPGWYRKGKLYFDIGSIDRLSDAGLGAASRDDASAISS
jgi:hypothetical protein